MLRAAEGSRSVGGAGMDCFYHGDPEARRKPKTHKRIKAKDFVF
jgi:hypothetical protein